MTHRVLAADSIHQRRLARRLHGVHAGEPLQQVLRDAVVPAVRGEVQGSHALGDQVAKITISFYQ